MEGRIERSPADVLRLVVAVAVALALLVVEWLFGDTLVGFASDLLRGLDALPSWMIDVVVVGTRILAVVVFAAGLVWALWGDGGGCSSPWWWRRRWPSCSSLIGLTVIERDEGRTLVDVGADLGPLSNDGFPTVWGVGAVAAGAHGGGAVAEPSVAAGRMGAAARHDGLGLHRLARVVRLAEVRGRRMGRGRRGAGGRRGAVASPDGAGRDRRAAPRRSAAARAATRRASTPADRRRTSASATTATRCSSRRSAPTSAAPTCCSACTGGSSAATSATRSRSRRCAAPSSTRRSSRSRRATCGVRTPRVRAFASGRPERLRPRLRRDRRQIARPRRPGRGHRRRARRRLATRSASCATAPHRPPRPAAGQHLPRRRRRGVAHRLRLQRAGRLGPAAGDRRRRADRLVQHRASGPSGPSPTRSPASTPTTLSRALRPVAPVGAERRDPDRAQGPTRAARRPARPASPRVVRRRRDVNAR